LTHEILAEGLRRTCAHRTCVSPVQIQSIAFSKATPRRATTFYASNASVRDQPPHALLFESVVSVESSTRSPSSRNRRCTTFTSISATPNTYQRVPNGFRARESATKCSATLRTDLFLAGTRQLFLELNQRQQVIAARHGLKLGPHRIKQRLTQCKSRQWPFRFYVVRDGAILRGTSQRPIFFSERREHFLWLNVTHRDRTRIAGLIEIASVIMLV
jgi:hypothetical protein